VEARNFINNTSGGTPDGPYDHEYLYDRWGNLLQDWGRIWSRMVNTSDNYDVNNRVPFWSYDAEGNVLSRNEEATTISPFVPARYTYDAAGRQVGSKQTRTYRLEYWNETTAFVNSQTFDGDNEMTHYALVSTATPSNPQLPPSTQTTAEAYLLRSTVLGSVISEYKGDGTWSKTHVYAGDERLGQQTTAPSGTPQSILENSDPITGDGIKHLSNGSYFGMTTLDAGGIDVGVSDPFPPDGSGTENGGAGEFTKTVPFITPIEGGGATCILDGLEIPCSRLSSESSVQCANNDCNATITFVGRSRGQVLATWVVPAPQGWDAAYDGTYVFNDGWPWRRKGGEPNPSARRNGGQFFNHVQLRTPQNSASYVAQNLVQNVFKLLNNDRCYNFISNLLDIGRMLSGKKPITYDAYELTRLVANRQSSEAGIIVDYGKGGGEVSGDIFSGSARVVVYLRPEPVNPVGVQIYYALVALHEIIHTAGGADQFGAPIYSDYLLARAANILTRAPGYPSWVPRTKEEQDKLRTDTGNYWDNQLWEHCNPGGAIQR
jgi:hypothetical protein